MRDFLYLSVKFARRRLVKPGFVGHFQQPDRFQQAQGTNCIGIGRIFCGFKTDLYMRHGRDVVDLIGLGFLNNPDQVGRIRHIAVMQEEILVCHEWILVKMVDPIGVEE